MLIHARAIHKNEPRVMEKAFSCNVFLRYYHLTCNQKHLLFVNMLSFLSICFWHRCHFAYWAVLHFGAIEMFITVVGLGFTIHVRHHFILETLTPFSAFTGFGLARKIHMEHSKAFVKGSAWA